MDTSKQAQTQLQLQQSDQSTYDAYNANGVLAIEIIYGNRSSQRPLTAYTWFIQLSPALNVHIDYTLERYWYNRPIEHRMQAFYPLNGNSMLSYG